MRATRLASCLSLLVVAGCGSGEQAGAASGGIAAVDAAGGANANASGGITERDSGSSVRPRTTGGTTAAIFAGGGGGSHAIGGNSTTSGSRATTAVGSSAGSSTAGGATAIGGSSFGGRSPATTTSWTGGSASIATTRSVSSGGLSSPSTSGGVGGTTNRLSAGGGSATTLASTGGVSAGGSLVTGGSATGGGTTGRASSSATTGAPEIKPLGFGQATTGCGSNDFVDADSLAAVQKLIDDYAGVGGLCIRYTGRFDYATISDPCTRHQQPARVLEIKRKSDITLLGGDASAADFGIHIASSSSNIIIRNMTLGLLAGGSDSDALSIEGMSDGVPTKIWIDHNELFSSMVDCAGAGDTAFDGLIDAKKGADDITVSYNYIHDHHKVSLNGYSDSDDTPRHITFHHNLFENVGSRTPLQRFGYSHLLNNYFNGVTVSGINVRMRGYSLIEGNYFENCQNPVTSRDSTELGFWELRNNNIMSSADFATYHITWEPSDSTPTKDATDWTTTASFPIALGYTYTADPAVCLKTGLAAVAGAGKGLATVKCP